MAHKTQGIIINQHKTVESMVKTETPNDDTTPVTTPSTNCLIGDSVVQQVSIPVCKEPLSGQEVEIISSYDDEIGLYHDDIEHRQIESKSLCSSCRLDRRAENPDKTNAKAMNKSKKTTRKLFVWSDLIAFPFLLIFMIVLCLLVVMTIISRATSTTNAGTPAPSGETIGSQFQTYTPMENMCNNEIPHPPLRGKKGAAFTLRDEGEDGTWWENLPKVIRLYPYWNHSWGTRRLAQQPNDIEFIPMIWGYSSAQGLESIIVKHIVPQIQSGQVKRLLGFNEPDNRLQANLPVEKALEAWPILEQTNLPLISPSCQYPEKEWMQNFVANATAKCLRMEWVSVHWYGDAFIESFKRSMEQLHNMYQKPILIHEFAPADWTAKTVEENKWTEDMVLNFMKGVIPWLESTPWIVGYAWFSFPSTSPVGTSSALFDQMGEITTIGRYYASITTDTPHGDMRIGTDQDPVVLVSSTSIGLGETTLSSDTTSNLPEASPPLPGKKGAIFSFQERDLSSNLPKLSLLNVSWNRNWGIRRVTLQPDGVEFVPTLWDGMDTTEVMEKLNKEVVPNIQNGLVKRLLGFHAPDSPTQSNMAVSLALELWPALESLDIPLVSPSCFDPFGEWIENFMTGVDAQGLRVDWIGVRWSGYPDFSTFQNELYTLHEKYQRPLLLTGMAPDTTNVGPMEMLKFMKKALPWLESTEYIRGYAWMSTPNTAGSLFLQDDRTLTELGRYYASVSSSWPEGDQSIGTGSE